MHPTNIQCFVLGAALAAGLCAAEVALGLDAGYRTSFFYLIPIGLVAWQADAELALAMGTLATLAWLAAKQYFLEGFASAALLWWNAATIGGYFLIIGQLIAKWRQKTGELAALALTDPLTGALNTRGFTERLLREMALANRHGGFFSVAFLDLDDFKRINDRFGHGAGDALLRQVAQTILSCVRPSDTVARMGGDEFALLFPGTSQAAAQQAVSKLLLELSSGCRIGGLSVTFSAGVVICRAPTPSSDEIMRQLDRLMYEAKRKGKNAVCCGTAPRTDGGGRA